MQMRILTINVQNLEGDPRRQQVLNDGLRRLSPDLVALQEVIQGEERRQLDELLAGTGLEATHQAQTPVHDPPWVDHYGGTAIATRWPHRVVETLDLRLHDVPDVPWAAVCDGPGYTWTDANPAARAVIDQIVRQPDHARRIDYILIGSAHAHPKAHCRIESAKVVFDRDSDGIWASDHFGVLVEADVGND